MWIFAVIQPLMSFVTCLCSVTCPQSTWISSRIVDVSLSGQAVDTRAKSMLALELCIMRKLQTGVLKCFVRSVSASAMYLKWNFSLKNKKGQTGRNCNAEETCIVSSALKWPTCLCLCTVSPHYKFGNAESNWTPAHAWEWRHSFPAN